MPEDAHTAALLQDAARHAGAGRFAPAAAAYQRVLQHNPAHPLALYGLGMVHASLGRTRMGIRLLERAVAADPKKIAFRISLATLLRQDSRGDDALDHLHEAARLRPDDPGVHAALASLHEHIHRLDDARRSATRALSLDPRQPDAALVLARLDRRAGELAAAGERIEALIRSEPPADSLCLAHFELGRVRHAQGDYESASRAFVTGNAMISASPPALATDRQASYRAIEQVRRITAEQVRRWGQGPPPGPEPSPAFVVGFPRSGTTLTGQILGAHPQATLIEEKPLLPSVIARLYAMFPDRRPLARMLDDLTPEQILDLRRTYFATARRHADWRGEGLLVDKHPMNIVYLGLVNRVFPDASVIVVIRDPRDVCLSCFMQGFQPNTDMIHFFALDTAARYCDAVMRLYMDQRGVLTLRTLEARYEQTTADFESQAELLIESVGLPWDPGVLEFHTSARARYVATPSYEAVTRPVNRAAVGRWRRYRHLLEPVRPILDAVARDLGYDDVSDDSADDAEP